MRARSSNPVCLSNMMHDMQTQFWVNDAIYSLVSLSTWVRRKFLTFISAQIARCFYRVHYEFEVDNVDVHLGADREVLLPLHRGFEVAHAIVLGKLDEPLWQTPAGFRHVNMGITSVTPLRRASRPPWKVLFASQTLGAGSLSEVCWGLKG